MSVVSVQNRLYQSNFDIKTLHLKITKDKQKFAEAVVLNSFLPRQANVYFASRLAL